MVHDETSLRERVDEAHQHVQGALPRRAVHRGTRVQRRPPRLPAGAGPPTAGDRLLEPPSEVNLDIVSYDAKWRTGSVEDLGTQPVMHPELPPRMRLACASGHRSVPRGRGARLRSRRYPPEHIGHSLRHRRQSQLRSFARRRLRAGSPIGRNRLPCPRATSWFGMRSVAGKGSAVLVNLAPHHRAKLVNLFADTPEFTPRRGRASRSSWSTPLWRIPARTTIASSSAKRAKRVLGYACFGATSMTEG